MSQINPNEEISEGLKQSIKELHSVDINKRALSKNDIDAIAFEKRLDSEHTYCVNMMSSPGSGKTTLLEALSGYLSFGVIEGDLETNRDADRLKDKGIAAFQILTGEACHLTAKVVDEAYSELIREPGSLPFYDKSVDANAKYSRLLVIENVGNLVCPASYRLGSKLNIVILSTPEGDDKVLKYPTMFMQADLVLISKIEFAEVFDFNIGRVKDDLATLKKDIDIIEVSSKKDINIKELAGYIRDKIAKANA